VTSSIARFAVLAWIVAAATPAAAAPLPTLSPEELRPGQTAVIRTVFQGTAIETFDAEIVGVLQGGRAEGDVIVARATTPRVVQSGIAQGMSGSPVYVDGKLIGALSSGWSFSKEPLFGITPIREMLPLLDLPARDGALGHEPSTDSGMNAGVGEATFGEFRWSEDPAPGNASREPVSAAMEASSRPMPLPVPLACGGLHPAGLATMRSMFEPFGFAVVQGGKAPKTAVPIPIEPGSAVAVDLLRGDLHLAAIGTATYRDGDRVLIFGHPLFQSGDVRLPLSNASITTIVASQLSSFKLGAPGEPIGVLTQDRRTAMAGRIGPPPHLLRVEVNVAGLGTGTKRYHYESIEDRTLAPQLLSAAAFNSVLESGGIGANQTIEWTMRLDRVNGPPLTMRDVTSGEAPIADFSGAVAGPLRFLFGNPFQRLELARVSIDVQVKPGRDQWALRSAELLGAAARPGSTLPVRCEVEQWRGERVERVLQIAVPDDLPDGRYTLWLGGGAELNRYEASKLPARFRPTSLEEAWRRFASLRPSNQLYATLIARAPEVTADGRDYPLLPNSALAILASGQAAGDQARRGDRAFLSEQRTEFDGPLRGELQLEVMVDAKAPLPGREAK
jgi:SpoIVB peptidase S55